MPQKILSFKNDYQLEQEFEKQVKICKVDVTVEKSSCYPIDNPGKVGISAWNL